MKKLSAILVFVFSAAFSLTGCSSSGDNTTVSGTKQMGGAIQGNSLNLSLNLVVTTLTGSNVPGSIDGTGTEALFDNPGGITTDGINLYVVDTGNHTIRQIAISSGKVTTLAGTAGVSGSTDGIGSAALFYYPGDITTDGTYLYVSDSGNSIIRKIVISTGAVTTLAGKAGSFDHLDGIGTDARLFAPTGITTDGANLYVADQDETIRQIVISSGVVTTLAGTLWNLGSTDGVGHAASFNFPTGITTDGTNLYVVDTQNYTIRQIIISTGQVTTLAGAAGISGVSDGIGSTARFNRPYGISTDGTNLYVAEPLTNSIRKIDISTGAVTTLNGLFMLPTSSTTDGNSLYATDGFRIVQIH